MSPPGRPTGEFHGAKHDGAPVSTTPGGWTLSRSLLLLVFGTSSLALGLGLALLLAWRLPAVQAQSRALVQVEAAVMAGRAELLLNSVQARLQQLAQLLEATEPEISVALVARSVAADDLVDLVAVTTPAGAVQAVGLKARQSGARADATGMDLSGSPLFTGVDARRRVAWTGRHLSMFTGTLTVGLSVRLDDGRVLVAEIGLDQLVSSIGALAGAQATPSLGGSQLWLVDQRGEVMADTDNNAAVGRINLRDSPMLAASATSGQPLGVWRHENVDHEVAAVRSAQLGWTFVARQPAGLDHPDSRQALQSAAVAFGLTGLFSLALAPLLARRVAGSVQALVEAAGDESRGQHVARWPQGPIRELNQLSSQLGDMARQIHAQKADLVQLNQGLEQRVAERTQDLAHANAALQTSMHALQSARDDLVRQERLASLGGLVAGVAHELNTPLGNSVLAISTLQGDLRQFRGSLAQGLRKSALDALLDGVDQATDIAGRNLHRAADLVTSFKQVAVDQASGHRRRFDLRAVVGELLLTLKPTLARTPYRLTLEVPAGITLDSYPGSLGQIITNLVNNAVLHGFDGRDHGTITLRAEQQAGDADLVLLRVHDDGRGIPAALRSRVFDPFVTTRMGRGGSGLGLNIAHSIAANVLGGALSVTSEEGVGTTFLLQMPCSAPQAAVHEG